MNTSRGSRFLIDKIDAKLGGTKNELKFDIAVAVLGLLMIVGGAVALCLGDNNSAKAVLPLMLIMIGLSFTYVMIKEFISDFRRYRKENIQSK